MERHDSLLPRPLDSILGAIGATPLVRLQRLGIPGGPRLWGKCEYLNPGGSVKDRIGLALVEAAERAGTLKAGGTIVEATSGNTGVALAQVAAVKGYRLIITMPEKMSEEKRRMLRAYGAELVITPNAPPDHPDHYTHRAKKIARETPGAVYLDQFGNPANAQAHYRTTGPEIWNQLEGRVDAVVAGAGTGGTLTGVARACGLRGPRRVGHLRGLCSRLPGRRNRRRLRPLGPRHEPD